MLQLQNKFYDMKEMYLLNLLKKSLAYEFSYGL
jgi:hypothetical protein